VVGKNDWLIDSFFVKELINPTPRGVDFTTTIPVTENCVSQSLDHVFDNYEQKIKKQLVINQVFCTTIN